MGPPGASVLLIRPLLRANKSRRRTAHIVVFFIFLVANCGGLLTPIGDPPLLLGFLKGGPFEWTLRLWPQWLTATGVRSEEHTSELQSQSKLVCRLLLEKKKR